MALERFKMHTVFTRLSAAALFKSRMQLSSLPLTASDSNIELVSSQKLLGVIIVIDEHLTFKEHINKLSKNLSKKIGLLRKIRRYTYHYLRENYFTTLSSSQL